MNELISDISYRDLVRLPAQDQSRGRSINPEETAKVILEVGGAWAEGRNIDRKKGIMALLKLVADGKIEIFRDTDGIIKCRLEGGRPSEVCGHSRGNAYSCSCD